MNGANRWFFACVLCAGIFAGGCVPDAVVNISIPKITLDAPSSSKPRVPINAKLKLMGGKVPESGAASFLLSVTSGVDSPNAKMSIKFPTGVRVLGGPTWWRGEIRAGRKYRLEVSALVPRTSAYRVMGDIILITNKGTQMRKRVLLDIDMGKPVVRSKTGKGKYKHKAVRLEEYLEKKGR